MKGPKYSTRGTSGFFSVSGGGGESLFNVYTHSLSRAIEDLLACSGLKDVEPKDVLLLRLSGEGHTKLLAGFHYETRHRGDNHEYT